MKLKRSGMIAKIVIAALAAYAILSLITIRGRIDSARQTQNELASEVKSLEAANASLEYEINNSGDAKTIENIARDKLGLVLPGEVVYYDIVNSEAGGND